MVLLSLEKMKEVSKDAATVNSASGLVTIMHDFSVIVFAFKSCVAFSQ